MYKRCVVYWPYNYLIATTFNCTVPALAKHHTTNYSSLRTHYFFKGQAWKSIVNNKISHQSKFALHNRCNHKKISFCLLY